MKQPNVQRTFVVPRGDKCVYHGYQCPCFREAVKHSGESGVCEFYRCRDGTARWLYGRRKCKMCFEDKPQC